jgi:hypothetical protein
LEGRKGEEKKTHKKTQKYTTPLHFWENTN